jgi:hypothetical protein
MDKIDYEVYFRYGAFDVIKVTTTEHGISKWVDRAGFRSFEEALAHIETELMSRGKLDMYGVRVL